MTDNTNVDNNVTLDLSGAPSTLFLFGLAGSGKSFVGDLIGELCQWHIYHADDDLTDKMKLALKRQQPFTDSMRDEFFAIIIKKILYLQTLYKRLVITQAVYKERHRMLLRASIADMDLVMVDADDATIIKRLQKRSDGIGQQSAAALRDDFERPSDDTKRILNNSDCCDIICQLNLLYAKTVT